MWPRSQLVTGMRLERTEGVMSTFLFSAAAIVAVMNVDSVDTVGDAASSLEMYARCGAPFMHARPLTSPVLFSLRNMSDESARICCSLDSLLASSSVQVSIM